jgi:hypothetical protein
MQRNNFSVFAYFCSIRNNLESLQNYRNAVPGIEHVFIFCATSVRNIFCSNKYSVSDAQVTFQMRKEIHIKCWLLSFGNNQNVEVPKIFLKCPSQISLNP